MKQLKQFKGVIVVLGSPNDAEGNLLSVAMERCAQALSEFRKHPEYAVLATGGWGPHFNTAEKPHACYMKQELVEGGIPVSAFLPWAESSNTMEDASLSRSILETYPGAELIVVTSDFHAARARLLFVREFPDRQVTISESVTRLPPDVLDRLHAHEQKALEQLD